LTVLPQAENKKSNIFLCTFLGLRLRQSCLLQRFVSYIEVLRNFYFLFKICLWSVNLRTRWPNIKH